MKKTFIYIEFTKQNIFYFKDYYIFKIFFCWKQFSNQFF